MISFSAHPFKDDLKPLTLLRNEEDLFCGIFSIQERWEAGLIHIGLSPSTPLPTDIIPLHTFWKNANNRSITETLYDPSFSVRINRNHDFLRLNAQLIHSDLELIKQSVHFIPVPEHVKITGPTDQVFIEEGAVLEHVYLNTTNGPIYIGKQALIMDGTCLRGPIAIRDHSVVKMGAMLYPGTSIGRYCVIGGEVKNSIVYDYSNKAHEGYLGDSIIGSWCNLGAGTTCSNLKNTGNDVQVWNMHRNAPEPAGQKAGVIMGDFTRTAIQCSISCGTVIGVCANLVPSAVSLPTYIPSFTWFQQQPERYQLEKALEHIRQWMEFKGCSLSLTLTQQLTSVFNKTQV